MNRYGLRLYRVLVALSLLFACLIVRMAWLQLGSGKTGNAHRQSLSLQAVYQQSDEMVIDTGRGRFVDRNGVPLTGVTVSGLVAFPTGGGRRGTEAALERLAHALTTDRKLLADWLENVREPQMWKTKSGRAAGLTDEQARKAASAGVDGVAVVPYVNRYPEGAEPIHAIGYISQHPERMKAVYGDRLAERKAKETDLIGGAGLEKSLDRWLRGAGETEAVRLTDGKRQSLSGLGLRLKTPDNVHFPVTIRTTIDSRLQESVRLAMERAGVKRGAAVVLDASNADVLAIVSMPRFDPYRIGAEGTDERNHALTAYPPGSVFKTVTLAAALEAGIVTMNDRFRCDGEYDRYGLKCWREEGHGILTLEEAYAQSCNVAFATIADHLDPSLLQATADRLGFGRQIGWHTGSFAASGQPLRLLGEEEAGAIFRNPQEAEKDGGIRTGTGIGQRDVRITPLQAANLVVTLLHGGRVTSPRIVSEMRYADGTLLAKLPIHQAVSARGTIAAETAAAVLRGMRSVVQEGTAAQALRNSPWPLAGKSGTAELAGKEKARNDHWFIGYGPVEGGKPRYAVAVLIENEPAGLRNRASALFGDIMSSLLQSGSPGRERPGPASAERR